MQRGFPTLKSADSGKVASDEINDHVNITKANFQVWWQRLWFDLERGRFRHVYLPRVCYVWMIAHTGFHPRYLESTGEVLSSGVYENNDGDCINEVTSNSLWKEHSKGFPIHNFLYYPPSSCLIWLCLYWQNVGSLYQCKIDVQTKICLEVQIEVWKQHWQFDVDSYVRIVIYTYECFSTYVHALFLCMYK